jgi:hypothetical protein
LAGEAFFTYLSWLYGLDPADDPFIDVARIRDKGAAITSASGTFIGQTVSSRTTDIGAGGAAFWNGSKTFDLGANQRLLIGGIFRFDSLQRTFDNDPLAPAVGSAASERRDLYTFAGMFCYYAGSAYVGAAFGGNWGHGDWADHVAGATGNFKSHGYLTTATIGNVFTLIDTRSAPSRVLPTKESARQASGGYALQLDVDAHIAYAKDQIGGFADSSGFVWGDEQVRYWAAGGRARLFMTVPSGRLVWTSYVAGTIDSEFSFSHTLNIPAQTMQIPDTIFYGGAQTFWGGRLGVDVLDLSGIRFGAEGYFQQSSQYQIAGGQAYVRFPLSWLAPPLAVASR